MMPAELAAKIAASRGVPAALVAAPAPAPKPLAPTRFYIRYAWLPLRLGPPGSRRWTWLRWIETRRLATATGEVRVYVLAAPPPAHPAGEPLWLGLWRALVWFTFAATPEESAAEAEALRKAVIVARSPAFDRCRCGCARRWHDDRGCVVCRCLPVRCGEFRLAKVAGDL